MGFITGEEVINYWDNGFTQVQGPLQIIWFLVGDKSAQKVQ